eukprot:3205133-Alexandrium_andersonii.AAC.1
MHVQPSNGCMSTPPPVQQENAARQSTLPGGNHGDHRNDPNRHAGDAIISGGICATVPVAGASH